MIAMKSSTRENGKSVSRRQLLAGKFDRLADRYDRYAALEQEVGQRLIERCAFSRREPERILDLGCGTGAGAAALKQKYRRAQVIGLDLAGGMVSRLRRRSRWRRPIFGVTGDIAALPFARATADLIHANLVDCWVPDRSALFDEYRRVLRPDGMLLFTTFGPGSLRELREAVQGAGTGLVFPALPDLLVIGDALIASGFSEPVMDMETITLDYPGLDEMVEELEATGTALLIGGWEAWVSDARAMDAARESLRTADRYPLSFEIVYGTAFGPGEGQPRRTGRGEEATFSVDSLLRSRPIS